MREWLGTVAELLGRLVRWARINDAPTSLIQLAGVLMITRGVAIFSAGAAWITLGILMIVATMWRGSDV